MTKVAKILKMTRMTKMTKIKRYLFTIKPIYNLEFQAFSIKIVLHPDIFPSGLQKKDLSEQISHFQDCLHYPL